MMREAQRRASYDGARRCYITRGVCCANEAAVTLRHVEEHELPALTAYRR